MRRLTWYFLILGRPGSANKSMHSLTRHLMPDVIHSMLSSNKSMPVLGQRQSKLEASAKPSHIGRVDRAHGRITSASTENTRKNKGPR